MRMAVSAWRFTAAKLRCWQLWPRAGSGLTLREDGSIAHRETFIGSLIHEAQSKSRARIALLAGFSHKLNRDEPAEHAKSTLDSVGISNMSSI